MRAPFQHPPQRPTARSKAGPASPTCQPRPQSRTEERRKPSECPPGGRQPRRAKRAGNISPRAPPAIAPPQSPRSQSHQRRAGATISGIWGKGGHIPETERDRPWDGEPARVEGDPPPTPRQTGPAQGTSTNPKERHPRAPTAPSRLQLVSRPGRCRGRAENEARTQGPNRTQATAWHCPPWVLSVHRTGAREPHEHPQQGPQRAINCPLSIYNCSLIVASLFAARCPSPCLFRCLFFVCCCLAFTFAFFALRIVCLRLRSPFRIARSPTLRIADCLFVRFFLTGPRRRPAPPPGAGPRPPPRAGGTAKPRTGPPTGQKQIGLHLW